MILWFRVYLPFNLASCNFQSTQQMEDRQFFYSTNFFQHTALRDSSVNSAQTPKLQRPTVSAADHPASFASQPSQTPYIGLLSFETSATSLRGPYVMRNDG